MTELESCSDMPAEPQIHFPKASLLRKPSRGQIRADPYKDITVIGKLGVAKFPVYLTQSKIQNKNYAMKVFPPFENGENTYFQNEIRFASFHHPNIINTLETAYKKDFLHKDEYHKVSYILMEYATHGDLFTFTLFGRRITAYLGLDGNDFVLNGRHADLSAEEIYGPLTTLYGADAYLDKPFQFNQLVEVVKSTLEKRQGGALGRPDVDGVEASPGEVQRSKTNGRPAARLWKSAQDEEKRAQTPRSQRRSKAASAEAAWC